MKTPLSLLAMLMVILCCLPVNKVHAQQTSFPQDKGETFRSENWRVKENRKVFGISQPAFGPYTTTIAEKLDSQKVKKKTNEGVWFESEIGSGSGVDVMKDMTIQTKKYYRMQVAQGTDTAEAVFSVLLTSKEKRQTVLGKILSKDDEDKDGVIDSYLDLAGEINSGKEPAGWKFVVNHHKRLFGFGSAYLKNDQDSMYTKDAGNQIVLVNGKGEQCAGLRFPGMTSTKFYTWIRNDQPVALRSSIATLFAVIIGVKEL
jgi:hypothetical protein